MATSQEHPGFKNAVKAAAKREPDYTPQEIAAAIASKSRHASASAKRANPRLRRVKG